MNSLPSASLSLDMDNLWCYQRSFGMPQWENYTSFIPELVPRAVSFLNERQLKATFFIVGQDLLNEGNHDAIKSISASKFEIGNHSFYHNTGLHLQTLVNIEAELRQSHQLIEQICEQTPIGFRGPAFGVSANLVQALLNLNYRYDASILRSSVGALARLYHQKRASKQAQLEVEDQSLHGSLLDAWQSMRPFVWKLREKQLVEVPVTSMPAFRLPFHGTYLQYLADYSQPFALLYLKTAMRLCKLNDIAPSFLLHLSDFVGKDYKHNLGFLPGMKRTSEQKIAFMHEVMNCFETHYKMVSLGEYVATLAQDELPSNHSLQGR